MGVGLVEVWILWKKRHHESNLATGTGTAQWQGGRGSVQLPALAVGQLSGVTQLLMDGLECLLKVRTCWGEGERRMLMAADGAVGCGVVAAAAAVA